jgi:thiamine-phosphate pyrophosphorylase
VKDGIYRILDANLNRSREGLRVCEDVTRFALNSEALSKELKGLRHGIASGMRSMPSGIKRLLEARDPEGDVGRSSKRASEMKRTDAADIFVANIQRVKESLRVLEEFSKIIDAQLAVRFRRLRFRTYDIEKKAVKRLYDTA